MNIKISELIPVIISVVVIVLVAVLEKQSKLIAAVTATMPLTIPLALWIVYSSSKGDRAAIEDFTRSMVSGIIPTLAFAIAIWLGARMGLKLIPLIVLGYSVWGGVLLLILGLQRLFGF